MIYAIETQGRAVALTEKSDVITRLNTDQYLRDTVIALRSDSGKPLWDGVSTFTARIATDTEAEDYQRWHAASRLQSPVRWFG
jgi:hypothetical protein